MYIGAPIIISGNDIFHSLLTLKTHLQNLVPNAETLALLVLTSIIFTRRTTMVTLNNLIYLYILV